MTATPVLTQLARVAVGAVPAHVLAGIPARVIDIIGIGVRASTLDTSQAVLGFAIDQGSAPQATAIGAPTAMSAAEAAFVNGVLAHSLDYDDTHLPSILHPSASVVPGVTRGGRMDRCQRRGVTRCCGDRPRGCGPGSEWAASTSKDVSRCTSNAANMRRRSAEPLVRQPRQLASWAETPR